METLMVFLVGLSVLEQIYLLCAVLGGLVFLLQLAAMVFGVDSGHVDLHTGGLDAADMGGTGGGFNILSLQGLSAFFLMFGLVGFVLLREGISSTPWSLFWSTGAGVAALLLVRSLFLFFMKMQSSGTQTIDNTVGQEGNVYLTIPAEGTGKVMITLGSAMREFDAISGNGEELKTDTRIRVTGVNAGKLIVEKI